LIEREDELNEPHRSRIKLLIIRLMFALLRFQEGKSRLRHFLHHAKSSLLLLQETEEVAIQYHSWRELSQIIEQQIELLQSNPYPSLSISSLYVQLGDLHEQILNAPNQAQAAYRNALLYNPNDEHALDRIHTMLAKKGAFNECRELLLTQATQASSNHASELYVRAALLELNKLHHLDAAYNLLQQALELHPHNTKALELVASLEQNSKKPQN
jgi:tetratricopeptide (TPR) repeat protein